MEIYIQRLFLLNKVSYFSILYSPYRIIISTKRIIIILTYKYITYMQKVDLKVCKLHKDNVICI